MKSIDELREVLDTPDRKEMKAKLEGWIQRYVAELSMETVLPTPDFPGDPVEFKKKVNSLAQDMKAHMLAGLGQSTGTMAIQVWPGKGTYHFRIALCLLLAEPAEKVDPNQGPQGGSGLILPT